MLNVFSKVSLAERLSRFIPVIAKIVENDYDFEIDDYGRPCKAFHYQTKHRAIVFRNKAHCFSGLHCYAVVRYPAFTFGWPKVIWNTTVVTTEKAMECGSCGSIVTKEESSHWDEREGVCTCKNCLPPLMLGQFTNTARTVFRNEHEQEQAIDAAKTARHI